MCVTLAQMSDPGLIDAILGFLDIRSLALAASSCKAFRNVLSQNDEVWRHVILRSSSLMSVPHLIKRCVEGTETWRSLYERKATLERGSVASQIRPEELDIHVDKRRGYLRKRKSLEYMLSSVASEFRLSDFAFFFELLHEDKVVHVSSFTPTFIDEDIESGLQEVQMVSHWRLAARSEFNGLCNNILSMSERPMLGSVGRYCSSQPTFSVHLTANGEAQGIRGKLFVSNINTGELACLDNNMRASASAIERGGFLDISTKSNGRSVVIHVMVGSHPRACEQSVSQFCAEYPNFERESSFLPAEEYPNLGEYREGACRRDLPALHHFQTMPEECLLSRKVVAGMSGMQLEDTCDVEWMASWMASMNWIPSVDQYQKHEPAIKKAKNAAMMVKRVFEA